VTPTTFLRVSLRFLLCSTAVATPGLIRSSYHRTQLVPYHVEYRIPAFDLLSLCLRYRPRIARPTSHPSASSLCYDEIEQHRATRPNYLPHYTLHTPDPARTRYGHACLKVPVSGTLNERRSIAVLCPVQRQPLQLPQPCLEHASRPVHVCLSHRVGVFGDL
jgi:hypothetical protein